MVVGMTNALRNDWIDLDALDEVIWREYLRVSQDASGRLRSNEEQHGDNVRDLDRKRGWIAGEAYTDEGSASRYQRKRRAGFDELIADLEAGRFGAHVLVIWEASRGTRRVSEMAHLLELCEEQGVCIYVTTHHRLYNPRITRDWRTLMEEALDAEVEVRKTSERVRRATKADAGVGSWSGGARPFGYEGPGMTEVNADEAREFRRCVAELLGPAPKSLRWLATDLNRRGIVTSKGGVWHPGALQKVLASPRYAGKRTRHGQVVGDAEWPAIIDEVTHKRIVAVLANRTRVGQRGRNAWMLTGLLRCGRTLPDGSTCEASLVGNVIKGARRYVCRKGPGLKGCGGLGIKADPLEELLGDLATERLADAIARRNAATGVDDTAELDELAEIAVLRAEANEDRSAGRFPNRSDYFDLLDRLAHRQKDVDARLAAKVRDKAPLDLIAGEGGRPWRALDVDEQRARLAAIIDHVTVGPSPKRGVREFEAERVTAPGRIAWRV